MPIKPIHYIIGSLTFCVVFGLAVTGIAFSNKASCGLNTIVVDAAGESLKTWNKTASKSCYFLDLGCTASCTGWCEKSLKEMAKATKAGAAASPAEKIVYLCAMTTDAEENNNFPELLKGEINLRSGP
jgi:hypothetical protein